MSGQTYDERQGVKAEWHNEKSARGRDIAPLPDVVDPKRKQRCRKNFRRFCETYFANVFVRKWSPDHLTVIAKIQTSVLHGGLFAIAMPRGSGKTQLCRAAATWALAYGHQEYVCLIGASEDAANDILEQIKLDLETNDVLNADFPEICYPIRKLGGISKRARGQTLNGISTRIGWTSKQLILPTVDGSPASGARVSVAGITGRIRGMSSNRADGTVIRPSLVIIDDPQTDESARAPRQCADRLALVNGAILGLAGPGIKIAGFAAVTTVEPDDVADQMLDRKRSPEWQGQRTSMLPTLPDKSTDALWEKYDNIRIESLTHEQGIKPATDFYKIHQSEMDVGAVASWPQRFNADECSAIQHAMNLKLRDERSFWAEYQNRPLTRAIESGVNVTATNVIAKVTALPRGIVPSWAERVTAFADVQGQALFYVVAAFGPQLQCHVVDYGVWPRQSKTYVTLRDLDATLSSALPNGTAEGQLHHGLSGLTDMLLGHQYRRDG